MQSSQQSNNNLGIGLSPYFLNRLSGMPLSLPPSGFQPCNDAQIGSSRDTMNVRMEGSVSFPCKLYKCLEDAETCGFTDVISWQPDGKSFKVYNQERFVNEILPLFHGAIKFKSWQRQLNLYGFTRVHKGLTRGSYSHKNFIRGNRALAFEISRQKCHNPEADSSSSILMPSSESASASGQAPATPSFHSEAALHFKEYSASSYVPERSHWQNDILSDKGTLTAGSGGRRFIAGSTSVPSTMMSGLDMDALSVSSSNSVVMPCAEELSFLLDVDDMQLQHPYENASNSFNHFDGRNKNDNQTSSLQAIASNMPSACDLAADLSHVGPSPSQQQSPSNLMSFLNLPPTTIVHPPTSIALKTSEPRSFPWKLHEMLCEVERNGFQSIISWEPDGMSFRVHDCRLFVEKVMPLYFDQSRYESFRRQLRKYGFARLHKNRYRGAYHHKYFQKDNKALCKHITRGNANKAAESAKKSKSSAQAVSLATETPSI